MNNNDFLGHTSKRTFSRRGLFRASFASLGAAAFLRNVAAAAPQESTGRPMIDESTTAQTTFDYPLVTGTGGLHNTFGCFVNGWCVVAAGSTLYSTVQCLDIQSGNPNPHAPYWFQTDSTGKTLPALGNFVGVNGFAVAPGGDGKFYVVNVNNNALANQALAPVGITPPTALSRCIPYGDSIVYVSPDGYLNAITIASPNGKDISWRQQWRVAIGVRGSDASVGITGSRAVTTIGSFIAAFDLTSDTPQLLWGPRQAGSRLYELDIDNSTAYASTPGSIEAYSLNPDAPASPWKTGYRAGTPGAPNCYNSTVYFADDSGKFIALDASTGQRLWSIDLAGGAGNRTPIVIEDGIAYVTTSSTVNAIDLVNRTNLTYRSSVVEFLGVENGIAFLVAGDTKDASLVGVDLGLQVHGFASESKLLADGVVSRTNAQPANPVYRTVVQLVDDNKNPRAFISVKLWASDDVTIDAEGSTLKLSANNRGVAGSSFMWLTTDATGTIYFASQAADISSPAIYLWASFMDTEEAMVLYPDQEAANDLATATAASFQKKTFDNSPLLADGVDPSAAAKTLAGIMAGNGADAVSTLRNTRAQLQQRATLQVEQLQAASSSRVRRRRMLSIQSEESYLAYPGSTTNLLYQQFAGDTDRTFDATGAQPFQLTFDPKSGQLTFTPDVFFAPQQTTGLSLKDFIKRVVHGVEQVTKTICNKVGDAVKHVITTIVNGIEYIYDVTINALEDAVHVAVGVLKSIVKDVRNALSKAIEWLSFVFSWEAIKQTKDDIYNRVFGGGSSPGLVNQLRSWEQTYANKGIQSLQNLFDDASKQILSALGGVDSHYQNAGMQSQQPDGNDPKSVYNRDGAGAYAPTSMMTAKLNANIGNAQELPPASAASLAAASTSLIDLAQKVIDNAEHALGPKVDDLKSSFEQFIDSFRLLTNDPGAFIGTAFKKLTALFAQLAVLLLQCVATIVSSVIGNLAEMVDLILSSLTTPIHIPVLSDLWNAIFGSSMSYLDLACWITAVPASIITRAASVSTASFGSPLAQSITSLVATIPAAAFDAFNDVKCVKAGSVGQMFELSLGAIVLSLGFPQDFSSSNDPLYVFFAMNAIPWILNGISQVIGKLKGGTAFGKVWPTISTFFVTFSGLASIQFSCLAAFWYKSELFIGPNHLTFCKNFFSSMTDVCKVGLLCGEQARIAVGVLDVVFPVTAASLGVAASAIG